MSEVNNKSELERIEDALKERMRGEISIEKLKEIIKSMPQEVLIQYLDTFRSVSSDIKETQIEALKNISSVDFNKYVESLKTILQREDLSDEVLLDIANKLEKLATLEADARAKTNDTTERVHKDQTSFWKNAIVGIGGLAVGALSFFIVDKYKPK